MQTAADRLTLRAALATGAMLLIAATTASAVNVRDISHLQGARENTLMAVSLVVGLDGTGDGGNIETVRSLGFMLQQFQHSGVSLVGLNADNVALVHVESVIGPSGAREGAKLDVKLSAINGASSLAGGRLVQCQMLGPMATPIVFALASGDIALEDPGSPTTGIIRGGAVMERDVIPNVIDGGRVAIVLDSDHATFAIASSIAKVINDAEAELGSSIAAADGAGQVTVRVPTPELADPADFIARVLDLPVLMPDLKARIVINRRTQTIVITGDVEIDPVTFSHNGLVINTRAPAPVDPMADPAAPAEPTTVQQLTNALSQLQVSTADQIAIIWAIKQAGLLHAEVVEK